VRHAPGQLHISNAVHAPGMKRLLSVSQLAKKWDVLLQRDKTYVIHRQSPPSATTIQATATQERGVYILDVAEQ
jgi:hypothetical protein